MPPGTMPGPTMTVVIAAAVPAVAAVATPVTVGAAALARALPGAIGVPGALAAGEVLACRLTLDDLDRNQRQLAAVVDLADLELDLVADVDHVVDVLVSPAAGQLADLGDAQQAVLARQQAHERAEGRRLDDRAEEALADLGHVRVGDRVDLAPGRLARGPVGRADVDRAVVLDRDLGARVVLDRVDHLALRADYLADLVDRHLDRDDARGVDGHLAHLGDGAAHDLKDGQPGTAGLLKRAREHRRG